MPRWLRFLAVGWLGTALQVAVLTLLTRYTGIHYLWATWLAVESAILHNFAWHERVTWPGAPGSRLGRLFRFHIANGIVSIASNLLWMRLLVGGLGMRPWIANLIAICATAVVNYFLADRWVFKKTQLRVPDPPVSLPPHR